MHLSTRSKLLAIALNCLYVPLLVRGLPYNVNELVVRADVVDLDPTVDDTTGADDDGTTAATGTQDAGSDTSTEYDWPWPVIPDSGAHNGISEGLDSAGRPYINYALNTIEGAIPAERRSPVFFTDVKPPPPDNFVEEHLGGNGWDYFDAFPEGWEIQSIGSLSIELQMVSILKDIPPAGMKTNRVSSAMARSNMEPEVFVSMDSEGGTRSVFNGVQTYDGKGDIENEATWKPTNKGVGQIFYQTELPVLMRNPNTKKITAYKKNDQGNYEFTTQWDASLPRSNPNYKPRNYLPEMPLDSASGGPRLVPFSTPDGQAPQRWDDGYNHK
ncbi:hypothetical protein HO133_009926 [Letharia lupina]|uniref:Uncharacterized protein n=1 Tax=Letharia lupina TaxID=560253 RepID=A0A8H6FEC0_9LECA|nr:uncharacterized protein HO133_009926 [Letharia lupina]KAF6224733.1 hypothetical protein HO133_009926 [Letharia lupina]